MSRYNQKPYVSAADKRRKLQVRSADYGFTPEGAAQATWGDKKGATVDGAALVKSYPNGMVVRFEKAAA